MFCHRNMIFCEIRLIIQLHECCTIYLAPLQFMGFSKCTKKNGSTKKKKKLHKHPLKNQFILHLIYYI